MRILIFGKADILGNLALNRLLGRLHGEHHLEVLLSDHVVDCERGAPHGDWLVALERDFPLEVFFPAVDALPCVNGAANLTFEGLAGRFDVTVSMVGNVNEEQVVARVRDYAPDVILSCRHDYIFGPELISIPPCGFYNLHPGALPEYRGLSATFWTMLEGRGHANCTFYQIDPGIDTGPVVHLAPVRIDYSRSFMWNLSRVYLAGADAFLDNLGRLCRGPLPASEQDERASRYFSSPMDEDYRAFLAKGFSVADREDYLQFLGSYLPGGRRDPLLVELEPRLPRRADFGAC